MEKQTICATPYNKPFIAQRADPYVLRAADGSYYFTATYPDYDRIVLRHAATLEGLSDASGAAEREIWHAHTTGPMGAHIWAPELHCLYGEYYIYFAAGDAEERWRIRPYVLHCTGNDPMNDAWEELGPMQAADEDEFSFRAFSLDATIFQKGDDYYYIWAEKVGVGKMISNLYIARMAAPNKLATVQVLLSTPDYDWERVGFWVDEGPAVLRHDGKVFVTFSGSATGACYCMGMLWAEESDDLLDPQSWHKLRYPVLHTDAKKGLFGPGHNCFTKAENGVSDVCVYHARQYEEIVGDPLDNPDRHAYRMPVQYDAKGFPIFRYAEIQ